MHEPGANKKLEESINFTREDLHMNVQGLLTPAQIQILKKSSVFNGSKFAKLYIILMIIGFFALIGQIGFGILSKEFIVIFLVAYALTFLLNLSIQKNEFKQLVTRKNPVEKIEGVIKVFYDDKISSSTMGLQHGGFLSTVLHFLGINIVDETYALELGGKKIMTTRVISQAFESGKNYRLYFVRTSKMEYQNTLQGAVVVSAELL